MTVTCLKAGSVDASSLGKRWVLVLGGVTRVGNRKARRAATEALESGLDVVWFDGFEEKDPESNERIPLQRDESHAVLQVVSFVDAESETLAGRMRSGEALQANATLRFIWRYVLRRLGRILRPRACWTTIRQDIKTLNTATPPAAIVYGDDYSITSAWYAGRLWVDVPLSTKLVETDQ